MENDAFYGILWKMTHVNPTMENDTMENDTMERVTIESVTMENDVVPEPTSQKDRCRCRT